MATRYLVVYLVWGALLAATACVKSLSAAPVPAQEYTFVPNTGRWVEVIRGEYKMIGKLDREGNFVPTYIYPITAELSCAPARKPLTSPSLQPRKVYEFRSGRLIQGELLKSGNFVPDLGCAVMRFDDYKFSPEAIPIWNLPGDFTKVDRSPSASEMKK